MCQHWTLNLGREARRQSSHHYDTARESWAQVHYPKSSSYEISFFSCVGISCLPHQSPLTIPLSTLACPDYINLSLLWPWLDLDNREPGQELGREGRVFFLFSSTASSGRDRYRLAAPSIKGTTPGSSAPLHTLLCVPVSVSLPLLLLPLPTESVITSSSPSD